MGKHQTFMDLAFSQNGFLTKSSNTVFFSLKRNQMLGNPKFIYKMSVY